MDEVKLAKLFHQVYEDLAPSFGYETRTDTKEFDEDSKNGKLMIATCKAILPEILSSQLEKLVSRHPRTKEQIFEEIENQFEYKLNIEVDCYWKLPPKDRTEEMKRKQIKLLIKSRIAKFLSDKENCATLMNVMLSS